MSMTTTLSCGKGHAKAMVAAMAAVVAATSQVVTPVAVVLLLLLLLLLLHLKEGEQITHRRAGL
jgi:hypothetical protein